MLARRRILTYAAECHVRLCRVVVTRDETRYNGHPYNILVTSRESAV
jgi:hypothetical protein